MLYVLDHTHAQTRAHARTCLSCLTDVLRKLSKAVFVRGTVQRESSLLAPRWRCGQAASDRPVYGAVLRLKDVTLPVTTAAKSQLYAELSL